MSERLGEALHFLATHHVMSLALCRDGAPHCCSLMYVHEGFALSWMSDFNARHSQIIDTAERAPASVVVAPDYDDFRMVRGLQMTGSAVRVGLADTAEAIAPFVRRYSFLNGERAAVLAAAMAKSRIYRFFPNSITFIDSTVAFGAKAIFDANDLVGVGLTK